MGNEFIDRINHGYKQMDTRTHTGTHTQVHISADSTNQWVCFRQLGLVIIYVNHITEKTVEIRNPFQLSVLKYLRCNRSHEKLNSATFHMLITEQIVGVCVCVCVVYQIHCVYRI